MSGIPYNKNRQRGRGFHRDDRGGRGGRGENNHDGVRGGRGGRGGRGAYNDRDNAPRGDVIGTLFRLLFEKHQFTLYNADTGMLKLNNLSECEELSSMKKSVDFNTPAFCQSLIAVVKELIVPGPQFIDFSNNRIKGVTHLLRALVESKLSEQIGGLSFANNAIESVEFIGILTKFPRLQELVLAGNPVRQDTRLVPQLRKRIVTLLGLDGEAVARRSLALPWPRPPELVPGSHEIQVLQSIESNLCTFLSQKQFESAVAQYAEKASFAFGLGGKGELFSTRVKGEHHSVQNDFASLKTELTQYATNILQSNLAFKHVARDRISVAHVLKTKIYRDKFTVLHAMSQTANVVFLDTNVMKEPTCIATIHGRMCWQHAMHPETKSVCFDRTFSLVFQNAWVITSDSLTLRRDCEDPVYYPDSPSNLEMLEKKLQIPKEVVAALVKACSNEAQLDELLSCLPPPLLAECCRVAQNHFDHAVMTARICVQRNIDPNQAYGLLSSNNFSMPQ